MCSLGFHWHHFKSTFGLQQANLHTYIEEVLLYCVIRSQWVTVIDCVTGQFICHLEMKCSIINSTSSLHSITHVYCIYLTDLEFYFVLPESCINTLRPRKNGCNYPDSIFKCIFLNENCWILMKISSKFVPQGPINNIQALVKIMAWHRSGVKPLSESMVT